MSAQTYQPLQAVAPLPTKQRFAMLLMAREYARRALDAALAAPRKAAHYVGRLVQAAHLDGALSWLRRAAGRVAGPVLTMASRLGRTGIAAGVTAVLTNPTCRKAINRVADWLGRGLGWLARTVYSGIDRGLRLFGKRGNKAADLLFAGVVSLGGKVASIAAPVVHRVARLADPASPQARLISGISRSFVLHRVLKALIGNSLVRLLVEGVLIPTLADSRLGTWVRQQLRIVRQRAVHLQEQTQTVPVRRVSDTNVEPRPDTAADDIKVSAAAGDFKAMPLWITDTEPVNRAERRAQQRTKPRNARHQ